MDGIIALAAGAGVVSMFCFGVFLFGFRVSAVELGFDKTGVVLWDSMLCALFFIQHSVMVRKSFRRRVASSIPEHFIGVFYTIASAVALYFLVFTWQDTGPGVLVFTGIQRWFIHGVFVAALAGIVWGVRALGAFDMFGVRSMAAKIRHSAARPTALKIRGPYLWMRHPLCFFILVMIWCSPQVTVDRLLFNILFTAWIIVGTLLEERDLVGEFGAVYRRYQREVPMLIPWKLWKPYSATDRDGLR